MISVDLPATMECDSENNCKESNGQPAKLSIKLVLNAGGTLAPQLPNGNGWQIGVNNIGVFLTRCPKHHQLVEEATAPRLNDLRMPKH